MSNTRGGSCAFDVDVFTFRAGVAVRHCLVTKPSCARAFDQMEDIFRELHITDEQGVVVAPERIWWADEKGISERGVHTYGAL